MKKILIILILLLIISVPGYSMHIMEGFLPPLWSGVWWAISLFFLILGSVSLKKIIKQAPDNKILLALAAAFIFILSALKIPTVTGSSSHPTGIGLGTVLFGPWVMGVLSFVVLLFQALLLAHGGITTLGANTLSMGVAGPVAVYLIFTGLKKLKINNRITLFTATALGSLMTYCVTALQLALAHHDRQSGVAGAFLKFFGIFVITQVPIAIAEGILTVIIFNLLYKHLGEKFSWMKTPDNSVAISDLRSHDSGDNL